MWPERYLQWGPLTLLLKLLPTEKVFFDVEGFTVAGHSYWVLIFNRTLHPTLRQKTEMQNFITTLHWDHSTRLSDAFARMLKQTNHFFLYFFLFKLADAAKNNFLFFPL